MKAQDAAKKVRQVIRSLGYNPKGLVKIIKSDYTTEISVDLKWMGPRDREVVDTEINCIDDEGYSWYMN